MKWIEKYKYHMLALLLGLSVFACLMKSISNNQQKEVKKNRNSNVTEEEKKSKGKGTEKEVEDSVVRVVLKTDGFANVAHPEAGFQAAGGLKIQSGDEVRESAPGEVVTICPDDAMFAKGTIHIEPKEEGDLIAVVTLNRGCGVPNYRGKIELFQTAEGVVIVNELSMEQYLYGVVPSEMPASYEPEALKVQAVCARSYAYKQTQGFGYPEYQAHIDDSTAFQVYGNSGEQASTNRAVDETRSSDHGLLFFYILRKDDNGGGVGKCFAGERVSTECRDQRCRARLRSRPSMVSMAGGHSDKCTDKYDQSKYTDQYRKCNFDGSDKIRSRWCGTADCGDWGVGKCDR